jgi:drug/metabolite transporter (DMT)-like permease
VSPSSTQPTLPGHAKQRAAGALLLLLLAREAVFAAISSAVWLGERLDARRWCGVALMMSAIATAGARAWRRPLDPGTAA